MIAEVTSQVLQNFGKKGTVNQMSLQTTVANLYMYGADVTWHGSSFQTQAAATEERSIVDSRQPIRSSNVVS